MNTSAKIAATDIVIVGGGYVGLSLALALSSLPIHITIIEAKAKTDDDRRSLALNYGSCRFLEQLGLWQSLSTQAQAIKKLHISERGYFAKLRFDAEEEQVPALAYVVAGQRLLDGLYQQVSNCERITLLQPAMVQDLDHAQQCLTLDYQGDTHSLNYQLLIAADGAGSVIRQKLGVGVKSLNHHHSALLYRVEADSPKSETAYQRFTSDGTLAMLPLDNNYYKLVISGKNESIARWKVLDNTAFNAKLQKTFGGFLGTLHCRGEAISYPIQTLQATQQVVEHAVIIGNAAHTFSPIAAQGLNLSFQDVAVLAQIIARAVQQKEDFSALPVLQRYAKKRRAAQRSTQYFMRLLTKSLQTNNIFSILSRQLVLSAADSCLTLHHIMAAKFMGIDTSRFVTKHG
ncbi:MAG: FAD-dependent monooxygenase [Pseudomonadota bacterium]